LYILLGQELGGFIVLYFYEFFFNIVVVSLEGFDKHGHVKTTFDWHISVEVNTQRNFEGKELVC